MSLKSFLEQKDIRDKFNKEFTIPKMTIKKDLLATPISKRYSLVGTAFDYLLRFNIHQNNPNAITDTWVAENVISRRFLLSHDEILLKQAKKLIDQAKINFHDFLLSGKIEAQLLKSVIHLAQLDIIYRSGIIDENLGTVSQEDIDDLRNLIDILPPELFKAKKLCLLNPTFGQASYLVGGADADLLIDETLIEIKTIKNFGFRRDHWFQLIGYFVLHNISSIGSIRPRPKISKLAIYYSRHAYFHTIDIKEVINKDTFPKFVSWFKETARDSFEIRVDT